MRSDKVENSMKLLQIWCI